MEQRKNSAEFCWVYHQKKNARRHIHDIFGKPVSKHQRMFRVEFLWYPAFSSIPSTVGTQRGSAHTSVSRTGACLYLLPRSRQSHLALISAFWRKCLFSVFLLSIPMLPMVLECFRTNPNGRRNLFCAAKFPASPFYPPFLHPNPSQRRRKKLGESGSSRFSPSVPEVSTSDQLRDGSRHTLWDHRLKCIWRFPKMVVPPSYHCLKPD